MLLTAFFPLALVLLAIHVGRLAYRDSKRGISVKAGDVISVYIGMVMWTGVTFFIAAVVWAGVSWLLDHAKAR